MDPLHPLVPIQPPAPTPPNYNRIQRVERDPQEDSGPDWQRKRGQQQSDDEAEEQFEDDYDPDWSDPAAVEPYGPDGVQHESAALVDVDPAVVEKWDPRVHGERRTRPRDGDAPTAAPSGDDDAGGGSPDPGGHIDISA